MLLAQRTFLGREYLHVVVALFVEEFSSIEVSCFNFYVFELFGEVTARANAALCSAASSFGIENCWKVEWR